MITCIVKLRDRPVVDQLPEDEPISPQYTMAEAAQEVKEAFGKGGNPDAPIPEEFVGWVNTPPTPDGYFRCAFDAAYSQAMEYVQSIGGTVTCDIIAVEWEGQEMFQVGEYLDQDGVLQPEYLAFIASCPMKQVEVVE